MLEPAPAHLAQRQPDGRQARRGQAGGRDVVEAGHGDDVRDRDPELCQPPERAERQQVVGAADRGERHVRGEQRVDPERAAVRVEARPHDEPLVVGEPRLIEPAPIAGQPRPGHEQRSWPRQERDLAVAEGDERRDHRRDPGRVVDADVGLAEGVRREMDDRGAIGLHRREVTVDLLADGRVVESAPGKDDGRGADRAEQPDIRALAFGVALGAAGDDQEAGDRGSVLDAADDLREIRVGDVVDDDRDDRDPALEQPAGERVRDVVERSGRLEARVRGSRR